MWPRTLVLCYYVLFYDQNKSGAGCTLIQAFLTASASEKSSKSESRSRPYLKRLKADFPEHPDNLNTKSLFVLEGLEQTKGGYARWNTPYRFRHLISGKYLARGGAVPLTPQEYQRRQLEVLDQQQQAPSKGAKGWALLRRRWCSPLLPLILLVAEKRQSHKLMRDRHSTKAVAGAPIQSPNNYLEMVDIDDIETQKDNFSFVLIPAEGQDINSNISLNQVLYTIAVLSSLTICSGELQSCSAVESASPNYNGNF